MVKEISQITFTKDAFPDIRKMLGLKNLKCHYCNKRITKINVGGIMKDKTVCNDSFCLIQFVNDGSLIKRIIGGKTK